VWERGGWRERHGEGWDRERETESWWETEIDIGERGREREKCNV
jgi:hypothetical protein